MANEVTQTISIAYDDGTTDDSFVDSSFTRDSSGLKMQRIMQTIGTSEEVINLGDIGAGAMLKVMVAAVEDTHFSDTGRKRMLEILRLQQFNDMIPAGLPEGSGALVAHKTGAISRVQHDAAIVDLPDGRRYALVIFARDFDDERPKVKATARAISGLIYDYVVHQKRPE